MNSKSIKKNYLLNSIYQVINILLPFITTPYISRVLRAEGVGAYSYTFAIASYMGIFTIVGMDVYGQLQVAKCRDDKRACSEVLFGITGAKSLTTVLVLGLYCLLEAKLNMYGNLYWVMLIYFFSLTIDFTWFFQGIEEFVFIVTRNILVKAVGVACIFIFVKTGNDVIKYAAIIHGTALLGNAILIPYLRKCISPISIKSIHVLPHIRGGMVYFIPTIATSVYTMLDKFMIGWVTKSSYENGYYEQGYKIIQIALVVVTSLRTVTLPRVANLYSEKKYGEIQEIIDKSVQFVFALSLPMVAGINAVAPQLVPVFLGDSFEPCINIVRILSILLLVLGLSNLISGQCLTALGKQKQANVCVIVGAGVNFIINLCLIPTMGALGATVATVIAETIILCMFVVFSIETIEIKKLCSNFVRYFICSAVMFLALIPVDYLVVPNIVKLAIKVAGGVLIYGLILVGTKDELAASVLMKIRRKNR